MAATQEALYGRLDLALSWSDEAPERERTKHVHRLHPYLGQVRPAARRGVARALRRARWTRPRPVRGLRDDARAVARIGSRPATGVDVAGFNCLLMRVKTRRHNLDAVRRDLLWAHERRPSSRTAGSLRMRRRTCARGTPRAAASSSITARSSRRSPRRTYCASSSPVPRGRPAARRTSTSTSRDRRELEPYWCHKHRRTCRPVGEARRFLLRYTLDTLDRIESFASSGRRRPRLGATRGCPRAGAGRAVRRGRHLAAVSRADRLPRAASLRLRAARTGRAPSRRNRPPRAESAALRSARTSRASRRPRHARRRLAPGAPVCIVVNDRRDLYPEILRQAQRGSKSGSSDTSTAARAGAPSTSSRCSSVARLSNRFRCSSLLHAARRSAPEQEVLCTG